MKLYELDEDFETKRMVGWCHHPKSIAEFSVKFEITIEKLRREILPKLVAKHYLIKVKTSEGRVLYKLNPDIEN